MTAAFLPIACLFPARCLPHGVHNFLQFSRFALDYYPNSTLFHPWCWLCGRARGVMDVATEDTESGNQRAAEQAIDFVSFRPNMEPKFARSIIVRIFANKDGQQCGFILIEQHLS